MPVTISRRSWHYRFAKRFWGKDYEPHDLCGYFWRGLVLSTVVVIALSTGVLVAIAAVVFLLGTALWRFPIESLIFLIGMMIILWLLTHQPRRRTRPPKPPNLVVSYLQAKKERYCPRIELTP